MTVEELIERVDVLSEHRRILREALFDISFIIEPLTRNGRNQLADSMMERIKTALIATKP